MSKLIYNHFVNIFSYLCNDNYWDDNRLIINIDDFIKKSKKEKLINLMLSDAINLSLVDKEINNIFWNNINKTIHIENAEEYDDFINMFSNKIISSKLTIIFGKFFNEKISPSIVFMYTRTFMFV